MAPDGDPDGFPDRYDVGEVDKGHSDGVDGGVNVAAGMQLDPDQQQALGGARAWVCGLGRYGATVGSACDTADKIFREYDIPVEVFVAMLQSVLVFLLGDGDIQGAVELQERYRLPVTPKVAELVHSCFVEKDKSMWSSVAFMVRTIRVFDVDVAADKELWGVCLGVFESLFQSEHLEVKLIVELVELCKIPQTRVVERVKEKLRNTVVNSIYSSHPEAISAKKLVEMKEMASVFGLVKDQIMEAIDGGIHDLVYCGKIEAAKRWRKIAGIPIAKFDVLATDSIRDNLSSGYSGDLASACAVQKGNPVEVTRKMTSVARAGFLGHLNSDGDRLGLDVAVNAKNLFGVRLGHDVRRIARKRVEREIVFLKNPDLGFPFHRMSYFADLLSFIDEFELGDLSDPVKKLFIGIAKDRLHRANLDCVKSIFDALGYSVEERKKFVNDAVIDLLDDGPGKVGLIGRLIEVFSLEITDEMKEVATVAVRQALEKPMEAYDISRGGFPEIELMEILGLELGPDDKRVGTKFVLRALRSGHMNADLLMSAARVFDVDVTSEAVVNAVIVGTIMDLRNKSAEDVKKLLECLEMDDDVQQIVDAAVRRVARQLRSVGGYKSARGWEKEFPGAKVKN